MGEAAAPIPAPHLEPGAVWCCQPQPSLGSADPAPALGGHRAAPPSATPSPASNSSLETGISLPGAASQSLHPALELSTAPVSQEMNSPGLHEPSSLVCPSWPFSGFNSKPHFM